MKKPTLLFLILAIVASTVVLSCQRNVTPPTPPATQSTLILGKWTVKEGIGHYIYGGNDDHDTTAFTASDYFQFNADSTLNIFMDSVAYNGNWKIANSKLFITNTNYMDAYVKGFDLPILTRTDLQLRYEDTTYGNYLEQKLNFYR